MDRAHVRATRIPQGKIRVLVVDDSPIMRRLISQVLSADPAIEIAGAEANGALALERMGIVKPDVVTLDIEMPVMNGLETLQQIRKLHPHLRTVMFSSLTTRGGSATFEALSLGADDYVAKGSNEGSLNASLSALQAELLPKIKQFFSLEPSLTSTAHITPRKTQAVRPKPKFRLLAIGTSTGGPKALSELIPKLPRDLSVPVLVVQHMPPLFTKLLAERLQASSCLAVSEAEAGMRVELGRVIIAKGDHHLKLRRQGDAVIVDLTQEPPENFCRPAVDVLFRSAAELYGGEVLSVVLTGMGSDGVKGTRQVKAAGGYSLAQDEQTSTVWGMPGSVVQAGLADEVLPLPRIASEIIRLVSRQS